MGRELGPDRIRNRNVFGDYENILGRMENIRQGQGPVYALLHLEDGIVGEWEHFVERKGCVGQQNLAFKRTAEKLDMFLERGKPPLCKRALAQDLGAMEIGLKGIQVDCVGHSKNDWNNTFKL